MVRDKEARNRLRMPSDDRPFDCKSGYLLAELPLFFSLTSRHRPRILQSIGKLEMIRPRRLRRVFYMNSTAYPGTVCSSTSYTSTLLTHLEYPLAPWPCLTSPVHISEVPLLTGYLSMAAMIQRPPELTDGYYIFHERLDSSCSQRPPRC